MKSLFSDQSSTLERFQSDQSAVVIHSPHNMQAVIVEKKRVEVAFLFLPLLVSVKPCTSCILHDWSNLKWHQRVGGTKPLNLSFWWNYNFKLKGVANALKQTFNLNKIWENQTVLQCTFFFSRERPICGFMLGQMLL